MTKRLDKRKEKRKEKRLLKKRLDAIAKEQWKAEPVTDEKMLERLKKAGWIK